MAIGLKSFKQKACTFTNLALTLTICLSLLPGTSFSNTAQTTKQHPGPTTKSHLKETEEDNFVYVVQPGDNLLGIRARLVEENIEWQRIAKFNHIANTKNIPVGTRLLIPFQWLASQPSLAKVQSVSGKVSANGTPLVVGTVVLEKTVITTDDNSSVVIELSDGSKLRVGSASKITIDRLKQYHSDKTVEARVRLEKGRVEAIVSEKRKRPFDILTPGATASVRGTNFGVSIANPSSGMSADHASVDVGTGNVDWVGVRSNAKEGLPGGFGSSVDSTGAISKPEALLPQISTSAFPQEVTKTISTLQFQAIAGAATYRIQVASDEGFEKLLYENIAQSSKFFLVSENDGEHFVRVKAISGNLIEGLTANAKVNVRARPVAPDGMGPPNETAVYKEDATLSWLNAPGISYRLQVAKGEDFKNPILDSLTTQSQANLQLTLGKTFWRVASIDQGKQGPFSDPKHIELRAAPKSPVPKTKDDILELNSDIELSEKGSQLEVYLAKDADFKNALEVKKLSASPASFKLSAGKYFIKTRYILEGFKADAVPFGPVMNITMIEPVRDTYGNSIRTGDDSPLILGR